MLERTNFVRDVNKNHDISIPSDLKGTFRAGDHYRVYHDVDSGAIAYVPNNYPTEEKFMRNLSFSSSSNESKRNKCILRFCSDEEAYLSLTKEQVDFFNWLKRMQVIDIDYELVPISVDIDWLEV